MKVLTLCKSGLLKFLKGSAILTVLATIGFASYYLYEISIYGDPATIPSPRAPFFLMIGGLAAALGFLITGIFRNREACTLREKLDYREQEITEQRMRIKELENPLGYELSEDPFSP